MAVLIFVIALTFPAEITYPMVWSIGILWVDQWVNLATPLGTSAIAVVRASGPDTSGLAQAIFGATPPPRLATHADYRDRAGTLVDDVLVTFFQGPRSYTGEDSLEVSCHGNPFIAQKILEDLFARGCRPAARRRR
mgnify:CR=1 FL=1